MAAELNFAVSVKKIPRDHILDTRFKILLREALTNPELNIHILWQFIQTENQERLVTKTNDSQTQMRQHLQEILMRPEVNVKLVKLFLRRKINWYMINHCVYHGKRVNCDLCKQDSMSQFWCKPCIHKNWCCYCCILLGFFRYG